MRAAFVLRSLSRLLAVGGLLAVAGCNTIDFANLGGGSRAAATSPAVVASSGSPLIDFVATGIPGQQGMVSDPAMGPVAVTIDRAYTSALGHDCRRYTLSPAGAPYAPQTRYACLKQGRWVEAGAAAR